MHGDLGTLQLDVQKISHYVCDFRNEILPYLQMVADFTLDEFPTKACFQAVIKALDIVAGKRR